MRLQKKCKTCAHFEPAEALPGQGWCRHPRVDPAGVGYRKLERADELGCRDHRPLWWTPRAGQEDPSPDPTARSGREEEDSGPGRMLSLLDE